MMKQFFTLIFTAFLTLNCIAQTITGTVNDGENNLTNKYIVQAYGSPAVGGLYFVALTYTGL